MGGDIQDLLGDANAINEGGVDLRTRIGPLAKSAVKKYGGIAANDVTSGNQKQEAPVIAKPSRSADQLARAARPDTPRTRLGRHATWAWMNTTTLLAGKEGFGKTYIAHALATALAIKREYFAQCPQARRVLMWAGEDDANEMWRRQIAINRHFDIDMTALDGLQSCSHMLTKTSH